MAQKNRSQLSTASDDTFQDSPEGNITPTNHRIFNSDCIDSFANLEEANTFEGINTFNAPVKVNNKLDTAYAYLGGGAVMNIGATPANFLELGGTGYTITSFGTADQGTWRYIKFNGSGTLNNGTEIQCPTNADINFVTGDTCLVISEGSGNWIVFSYQRKDGSAVESFVFPWSYSTASPSTSENAGNGFYRGFRWIEAAGSSTRREYSVNDDNGTWMLMAGRMGDSNFSLNNCDINIDNPTPFFTFTQAPLLFDNYDIRYSLVSDVLTIDGVFTVDFVALNSGNPSGYLKIDLTSNDKNLGFGTPSTVDSASGFGMALWNGQGAPHAYGITVTDSAGDGSDLRITITTKNPHFGTGGTLTIYFTATIGCYLL
jgi:hypothetical protein